MSMNKTFYNLKEIFDNKATNLSHSSKFLCIHLWILAGKKSFEKYIWIVKNNWKFSNCMMMGFHKHNHHTKYKLWQLIVKVKDILDDIIWITLAIQ